MAVIAPIWSHRAFSKEEEMEIVKRSPHIETPCIHKWRGWAFGEKSGWCACPKQEDPMQTRRVLEGRKGRPMVTPHAKMEGKTEI